MIYMFNREKFPYKTTGLQSAIQSTVNGNVFVLGSYDIEIDGVGSYTMPQVAFYLTPPSKERKQSRYHLFIVKDDGAEKPRYVLRKVEHYPNFAIGEPGNPDGELVFIAEAFVNYDGTEYCMVFNSTTEEPYWTQEQLNSIKYPIGYAWDDNEPTEGVEPPIDDENQDIDNGGEADVH